MGPPLPSQMGRLDLRWCEELTHGQVVSRGESRTQLLIRLVYRLLKEGREKGNLRNDLLTQGSSSIWRRITFILSPCGMETAQHELHRDDKHCHVFSTQKGSGLPGPKRMIKGKCFQMKCL